MKGVNNREAKQVSRPEFMQQYGRFHCLKFHPVYLNSRAWFQVLAI